MITAVCGSPDNRRACTDLMLAQMAVAVGRFCMGHAWGVSAWDTHAGTGTWGHATTYTLDDMTSIVYCPWDSIEGVLHDQIT